MRKLWRETRDPGCTQPFNWVSKSIRRMNRKNAIDRWETKLANTELTPPVVPHQHGWTKDANWHSWPLCINYHPVDKANAIADCLENRFTPHNLCEENNERQVEARFQALLEAVDSNCLESIRPCDLQKLLNSLQLKEACGIDDIPNECLRHLSRRPLVHLTHLLSHCIRLSHFPTSWKESKVVAIPKPGKETTFPQNLRPTAMFFKVLF
jgi:hypothetical protein